MASRCGWAARTAIEVHATEIMNNINFPAVLLICSGTAFSFAADSARERIASLESKLLAPCCYSEPVSVHRSEVAAQMRAEIRQMVAEGGTDRAILDRYKAQYGLRVLRDPEGAAWWWVTLVPAFLALAGLLVVLSLIRKWRRAAAAAAP